MKRVIAVVLVTSLLTAPFSVVIAGRYYDARVARFTTPDPIQAERPPDDVLKKYGLAPFSMSPYSYGLNNPMKYVDPDGKFPLLPIFMAVACSYFATQYSGDRPGGSPSLATDAVVLGGAASGAYAPGIARWALVNPLTATKMTTAVADAFAPPGMGISPTGPAVNAMSNEIKGAYEVAKEGGKHSGLLRTMMNAEVKSIEKSISSFEKNILEHIDKLSNPTKYVEHWNKLSPQEQGGLLQKWQKDLTRNQELRDIMRGFYEERKRQ